MSRATQETQPDENAEAQGNESTNEEDGINMADRFEQHAHAPRFVRTHSAFGEEDIPKPRRTYSAFGEHLGEKDTGCKRPGE